MASFKDLVEEHDVTSLHAGGVKVFVESKDDLTILRDKWFFNYKDKLCFESVAEEDGSGGGCRAVVKKIENLKRINRPAFGIVDRDALLSDDTHSDTLWWEVDKGIFGGAAPYGEEVHVLERWELENYLLKPKALSAWLKDKLCSPEEPEYNAEKILENEATFVALSCISTLAVQNKKKSPANQFGRDKEGSGLEEIILDTVEVEKEELETHKEQILNFAEEETDHGVRWDKLSRLLDGKRVMYRMSDLLNKEYAGKNLNVITDRAIIAGYIANQGLVDEELKTTIDDFQSRA